MIKGVIFDMDGVLVDNRDIHFRAFEIFCSRYGADGSSERLVPLFGMGNDDIMRTLMPPEVVQARGTAALSDEKEAIYRQIYEPVIEPVRGLREFLASLKEAGIRCAVGSSGCADNVRFVLEKCSIDQYFDACISGDMVTRCKPDPEIYLTAAASLGLPAVECLVFEDALAGIEAAERAGMHVTAVATTLPREVLEKRVGAENVIDDFTQTNAARVAAIQ